MTITHSMFKDNGAVVGPVVFLNGQASFPKFEDNNITYTLAAPAHDFATGNRN